MSNDQIELNELALSAVRKAISSGDWINVPELSNRLPVLALNLLEAEAERQQKPVEVDAGDHIDADGWSNDVSAAWRLVLNANRPGSCVIYFAEEPDYATVKAFARAAGLPANQVKAEKRDNG